MDTFVGQFRQSRTFCDFHELILNSVKLHLQLRRYSSKNDPCPLDIDIGAYAESCRLCYILFSAIHG